MVVALFACGEARAQTVVSGDAELSIGGGGNGFYRFQLDQVNSTQFSLKVFMNRALTDDAFEDDLHVRGVDVQLLDSGGNDIAHTGASGGSVWDVNGDGADDGVVPADPNLPPGTAFVAWSVNPNFNQFGAPSSGNPAQVNFYGPLWRERAFIGTINIGTGVDVAGIRYHLTGLQSESRGIINGIVQPQATPEPAALAMLLPGLGPLVLAFRRRRVTADSETEEQQNSL
jgi:hypothetical protein